MCTNDSPLHPQGGRDRARRAAVHQHRLRALSDPNRFKFDSDEFYLKTPEEMAQAFARWPGACETTLEVAERCNVEISMGNLLLPRYEVPAGHDARGVPRANSSSRASAGDTGTIDAETGERAEYELKVIGDMGFAGYFLVVQDFVNWAKDQGIRVGPGRGSAAGSIVSLRARASPSSTRSATT